MTDPDLPLAVTQLMKGVVYRDTHERAWRHLLQLQPQVRDYVAVLGLQVVVDEAEGYAFCRQRPPDTERDDNGEPLPRLIPRRPLSFHVSLLLALLRKKLAEFDAQGGDTRLMLTRDQIAEMMRVFLPVTSNEVRLADKIDAYLSKAVDLGFLRPAKNAEPVYEVRRILKAFVDGQWLADFDTKLAEYAVLARGTTPQTPPRGHRSPNRGRRMTETLSGFRLTRLELYNWGTFDQRVWSLDANARNTLLTGDIGSGKSTIVDAVTTLLLPANRISYNKAAGADTRERSLRSYVLGYYKSERNEVTGTTKPVALRDGTKYSVILGVFANEGYDATVTIAQVFWLRGADAAGQPDRFYVTADKTLSVAGDFADFGSDMTALRRRLRAAGAQVYDSFPDYGKDFRRRLGIESEQAMELFHQTVSMKSVGNLTDFVRDHMLEPFDAAKWTANIVAHFDDLTKAHEAVQRARAQLAALGPLLAECEAHDQVAAEIAALTDQRTALKYYFADLKAGHLDRLLSDLSAERTSLRAQLTDLATRLKDLRSRERSLDIDLAGHGGNRLAEIDRLIKDGEATCRDRMDRAERFAKLLAEAGLDPVETADHFAARRLQIAAARDRAKQDLADAQNRLNDAVYAARGLQDKAAGVNAELVSLREHPNNIPKQQLDLRAWMCRELRLDPEVLPFAGELIAVRPGEADWEGAAERLLHGFALSVLVPDQHYAAVSDWIDTRHLKARVVYYRVPDPAREGRIPQATWSPGALAAKLEIRDHPFAPWLERELARRADFECVETMAEFRRTARASHQGRAVQGGPWPAREGRPAPHR